MPRTVSKEFSLPSFGLKNRYSQLFAWRTFLSKHPREEVQVLKHCLDRVSHDGTLDKNLKLCGACMLSLGEFAIGVTKKELLNSVPKGMRAGETTDSHISRILDAPLASDRKVPDFDPEFWSKYIPLAEILALERVCELVDPRDPSLPQVKYDLCDPQKRYVMDEDSKLLGEERWILEEITPDGIVRRNVEGVDFRRNEVDLRRKDQVKKSPKSEKPAIPENMPKTPSRGSSPSYSVKFVPSPSKRGGRSLDFLSPKKAFRPAPVSTTKVMDRVEILKTFEERLAMLDNPQAKEFTIEVTLSNGEKMTIASHAGFL